MKIKWSIIILVIVSRYAFSAKVEHVDNIQLKGLISQDVPVVDVCTFVEWKQTGVIEDSYLMMFYDEKGNYDLNK